MRLRSRRRNPVVWSLSANPGGRYGDPRRTRPARSRRVRRSLRIGALFTVLGLMRLAGGARHRWRPVLAGAVLVVVGVLLRGGGWGSDPLLIRMYECGQPRTLIMRRLPPP